MSFNEKQILQPSLMNNGQPYAVLSRLSATERLKGEEQQIHRIMSVHFHLDTN